MNSNVHKKIYKAALDALSVKPLATSALIESIMANLYRGIVSDEGRIGEFTEIRGLVGAVISEMKDNGVIAIENGECVAVSSSPLTLRLESCEQEILTFPPRRRIWAGRPAGYSPDRRLRRPHGPQCLRLQAHPVPVRP